MKLVWAHWAHRATLAARLQLPRVEDRDWISVNDWRKHRAMTDGTIVTRYSH